MRQLGPSLFPAIYLLLFSPGPDELFLIPELRFSDWCHAMREPGAGTASETLCTETNVLHHDSHHDLTPFGHRDLTIAMIMTATATTGSEELSPGLQSELRRRSQKLQMLPGVAVQALEIARDPNCSIREFVAVVERDAKLAADILSLVNSAMFSTGGPSVVSLQQAIVRLGFRQCRNLILSTSMASLMKNMSLEEEWVRDLLCRHAFMTGMIAIQVNRIVGAGFQGEEFAAGLMHDFGRILLAVCLPEQFNLADPLHFDESPEILQAEKRLMGTHHCEAGAWFAEINHLPAELVEVVRFHHTPEQAQKHRRLVALTSASDHMANHLQRCDNAQNYNLGSNEAVALLERCGVINATKRLQDVHRDMMNAAKKDAQKMWSV